MAFLAPQEQGKVGKHKNPIIILLSFYNTFRIFARTFLKYLISALLSAPERSKKPTYRQSVKTAPTQQKSAPPCDEREKSVGRMRYAAPAAPAEQMSGRMKKENTFILT